MTYIKRAAGVLAVLVTVGLGVLAFGSPAHAEGGHFPVGGWQVRQIGVGDVDWSPASLSTIVDAASVALTKPDATTGTSVETTDLGLAVTAGTVVAVSYTLEGGADTTAGAIRLFYYDTADADTLTVAPTAFVAADGSGTLSLTVAADATIGTLGLTYDASNASAGTVTFSDLTVGDTEVLFLAPPVPCEWDELLLAGGEKCKPPASPDPTPTVTPSPGVEETPAAVQVGGGGDELPVTGSSVLPLAGVGGAAVVVGVALTFALRRKKPPAFAAE